GEVGEDLKRIGSQAIVVEVMLHRPERVEAERLGERGDREVALVDLVIRSAVERVVKHGGHADLHAVTSTIWSCRLANTAGRAARLPWIRILPFITACISVSLTRACTSGSARIAFESGSAVA